MNEPTPIPPPQVWKFPVNAEDDTQVLRVPKHHTFLAVDRDPGLPEVTGGRLALWAVVRPPATDNWMNEEDQYVELPISVYGTGQPLPERGDMTHLGSVVLGPFIWHVFRDHAREKDPLPLPGDTPLGGRHGLPGK